jgi:hypothetical protein
MSILDLIQQDVPLRKVSFRDGGEYCGPCPLCQGKDRFRVWPFSSRAVKFWCRESGNGCGFKGDIIDYLRKVRGMTFKDACRLVGKRLAPLTVAAAKTKKELREERIDRELMAEYLTWDKMHHVCWSGLYRELSAMQEMAEIGYRATVRCPDLYTEEEKAFWERSLSELYDALDEGAFVPALCDFFTYEEHLEERVKWFDAHEMRKTLDKQS